MNDLKSELEKVAQDARLPVGPVSWMGNPFELGVVISSSRETAVKTGNSYYFAPSDMMRSYSERRNNKKGKLYWKFRKTLGGDIHNFVPLGSIIKRGYSEDEDREKESGSIGMFYFRKPFVAFIHQRTHNINPPFYNVTTSVFLGGGENPERRSPLQILRIRMNETEIQGTIMDERRLEIRRSSVDPSERKILLEVLEGDPTIETSESGRRVLPTLFRYFFNYEPSKLPKLDRVVASFPKFKITNPKPGYIRIDEIPDD